MGEQKVTNKNLEDIKRVLKHPSLLVSKEMVLSFGIKTAVFLSFLQIEHENFEDENKLTKDGYFYCGKRKIERSTKISFKAQTKIIKTLKSTKIIDVKKRGVPGKYYYKILLGVEKHRKYSNMMEAI